jgi:methylenetetrahydrofolate dehydrogenase (NADP+)/methenyltetrahydrofolate cyclohydrolase
MSARIIDGKAVAEKLNLATAAHAALFAREHGRPAGLAVVLVGEDPASQVYVRSKGKATIAAGMASFEHKLPASTSEDELLDVVRRLNDDPTVDGILVQMPVPKQIDADRVIDTIDPDKDVDGFHVVNAGKLAVGHDGLVPCTPLGCLVLLDEAGVALEGAEAVVVGRSNLVGKPVAQLLLRRNATVTLAHSRTRDLAGVCRRADVLIAAVGRARMIKGEWIKPGATVIDVGINRIEADGRSRLVGDVDYAPAAEVAGAITPVPGGVGPMTIACLLQNTLKAAERRMTP